MKILNIDVYQLKRQKKKIVCFGAGQMLYDFLEDYKDVGIIDKIELILDNNKEKHGNWLNIGGRQLRVTSVEDFCINYQPDDYIFLITCEDSLSVYRQLQQIELLRNMMCCFLLFVKGMTNSTDDKNRYYPENLRIYDNPVIPKIIHYCWFGGTEIPRHNREWMASWKRYCPDYEIMEWNEKNYDVKKNRFVYEAYQAGKWGFIPDYARLDIIYNYGGIYLDTDVEIIRNLDELLYQDAFVGVDGTKRISLGLGFGARPHFSLLKDLMREYENHSLYNDKGVMQLVPAPKTEIPFFKNRGYINNGAFQRLDNLVIYPEKVLSGKCVFTGKIEPTEHTFSIHHYDGSWDYGEKKIRRNDLWNLFQLINEPKEIKKNNKKHEGSIAIWKNNIKSPGGVYSE